MNPMDFRSESLDDEAVAYSEKEIEIDVIDVLVPCRKYAISYKVAELGKVSLTSEFLLRLVYTVEGVSEADVAAYFGFNDAEVAFIVNEMDSLGFLDRRQGELWLSLAGRELFKYGSDEPEIYSIEARSEQYCFDLISFAPAEADRLSSFEAALPELKGTPEKIAVGSKNVIAAFKRYFDSVVRRTLLPASRQTLCTVDLVTPLKRYADATTMLVRAKADSPGIVEPDFSDRWSGFDLDDRADIVNSAAMLLKTGRVFPNLLDAKAFNQLAMLAPEIMADFTKAGDVRPDALLRETTRRKGQLRIDRPTTLIVGTLFTDGNARRLWQALEYSARRVPHSLLPEAFLWQVPIIPYWGTTRRLLKVSEAISQSAADDETQEPMFPIGVVAGSPPRHLGVAFDDVISSRGRTLGLGSLELLLVPGRIAAVLIHAAFGEGESYPVPLGILSFDPNVVERATGLMRDLALPAKTSKSSRSSQELEAIVDRLLSATPESDAPESDG
jgi:hypothetical protein